MLARSRERILSALCKVDEFLTADKWGRDAPGLDCLGHPVDPLLDQAQRFCIQGALIRMAPGLEGADFRLVMQLLHDAARRNSGGRYDDIFAMNDDSRTSFDEIKCVLAETIDALRSGGRSLSDVERQAVEARETRNLTPLDAWVLARVHSHRHALAARTLALALRHAGEMGYARVIQDRIDARDANALLASQLFVRLSLQCRWPDQAPVLSEFLDAYSECLPDAWYRRLLAVSGLGEPAIGDRHRGRPYGPGRAVGLTGWQA